MEPSPLVYDTAAAAAVWQRVGPALPAYDAAPCPAGACCPPVSYTHLTLPTIA